MSKVNLYRTFEQNRLDNFFTHITQPIKYYPFNDQKVAMRTCPSANKEDTECKLRYLHADYLVPVKK